MSAKDPKHSVDVYSSNPDAPANKCGINGMTVKTGFTCKDRTVTRSGKIGTTHKVAKSGKLADIAERVLRSIVVQVY